MLTFEKTKNKLERGRERHIKKFLCKGRRSIEQTMNKIVRNFFAKSGHTFVVHHSSCHVGEKSSGFNKTAPWVGACVSEVSVTRGKY